MSFEQMRRHGRRVLAACVLACAGLLPSLALADSSSIGAVREGQVPVMALALGHSHACALRSDGGAMCWGNNATARPTPPAGVSFTALWRATATRVDCRLTVARVCWGHSGNGRDHGSRGSVFVALAAGGITYLRLARRRHCAVLGIRPWRRLRHGGSDVYLADRGRLPHMRTAQRRHRAVLGRQRRRPDDTCAGRSGVHRAGGERELHLRTAGQRQCPVLGRQYLWHRLRADRGRSSPR